MTTDTARRYRAITAAIVISAVFVFTGYATFEQWAGLVRAMLGVG
ncbi:hypothetical protein ACFQZQ_02985 [Lysobacter koreensis]|uniref:Uncharacterized protein n=1 Tax=Lysobacter koreensis TaxID=266122 RepID=A0ABW2YJU4_9GAMM